MTKTLDVTGLTSEQKDFSWCSQIKVIDPSHL